MHRKTHKKIKSCHSQGCTNEFPVWSVTLSAIISIMLPSIGSASESNHCTNNEKSYFSCSTSKNTIISICGTSVLKLKNKNSYIQYRYGKENNIEFEYPEKKANSLNKFLFTHYFRSQYDVSELEFTNLNYKYTVFWNYDGELESDGIGTTSAGIKVQNTDSLKEFTIKCSNHIDTELLSLESYVPCNKSNALAFDCR